VQPDDVSLEPLRDALLAEARARAARCLDEARAAARASLADARTQADALVARARDEAEDGARRARARALASARREARAQVLQARHDAYDALRRACVEQTLGLRASPGYPALLDRLERAARARLGAGARIERDPQAGGVRARAGSRSIDETLPALALRALDSLGAEVAGLWA
jgi:vacuolar-type H+-ATPase subunit E/Vma4